MGSTRTDIEALETTEKVLASLTLLDDRDEAIDSLIVAISGDRDRLLSAMVFGTRVRG